MNWFKVITSQEISKTKRKLLYHLSKQLSSIYNIPVSIEYLDKIMKSITPFEHYHNFIIQSFLNNKLRFAIQNQHPKTENDIVLEDPIRLKEEFTKASQIQGFGKQTFQDYSSFSAWLEKNDPNRKTKKQKREELQEARKGKLKLPEGTEVVGNVDNLTVIKINKGQHDLCPLLLGGTKWCVAYKETAKSYLNNGPLYLFYEDGVRAYLVDLITNQYKNIEDEEVDSNILGKLVRTLIKIGELDSFKFIENVIKSSREYNSDKDLGQHDYNDRIKFEEKMNLAKELLSDNESIQNNFAKNYNKLIQELEDKINKNLSNDNHVYNFLLELAPFIYLINDRSFKNNLYYILTYIIQSEYFKDLIIYKYHALSEYDKNNHNILFINNRDIVNDVIAEIIKLINTFSTYSQLPLFIDNISEMGLSNHDGILKAIEDKYVNIILENGLSSFQYIFEYTEKDILNRLPKVFDAVINVINNVDYYSFQNDQQLFDGLNSLYYFLRQYSNFNISKIQKAIYDLAIKTVKQIISQNKPWMDREKLTDKDKKAILIKNVNKALSLFPYFVKESPQIKNLINSIK